MKQPPRAPRLSERGRVAGPAGADEEVSVEIRRRRPRWWAVVGVAALAAFVAFALTLYALGGDRPAAPELPPSASEEVSAARRAYEALAPGMARADVERLLGGAGEEISWRRLHGNVTETYAWDATAGSMILVTFQNGVLVRKSELGLY